MMNIYLIFMVLLVILGIIFIHELGHYLMARSLKIPMQRFVVGIGPTIYTYRDKSNVIWSLRLFPVLGYVQFFDQPNQAGYFNSYASWKRVLVVLAGPLANFLLALACFMVSSVYYTYFTPSSDVLEHPVFVSARDSVWVDFDTKDSHDMRIPHQWKIADQQFDFLQPGDRILNLPGAAKQLLSSRIFAFYGQISRFSDDVLCTFLSHMPLNLRIDRPVQAHYSLNNAAGQSSIDDVTRQNLQLNNDSFLAIKKKIFAKISQNFQNSTYLQYHEFLPYVNLDLAQSYWDNKMHLMQNLVKRYPQFLRVDIDNPEYLSHQHKLQNACMSTSFGETYDQNLSNDIQHGMHDLWFAVYSDALFRNNFSFEDLDMQETVQNYLHTVTHVDLVVQRPTDGTQDNSHVKIRLEGTRVDLLAFLEVVAARVIGTSWYTQTWTSLTQVITLAANDFYINIKGFLLYFYALFTGETGVTKNLVGVIGIGDIIYDTIHVATSADTDAGYSFLFFLIGSLSSSIAMINLLPIPITDGGRLVFILLEHVVNIKILRNVELILGFICAVFFFVLFLYISYYDILNLLA